MTTWYAKSGVEFGNVPWASDPNAEPAYPNPIQTGDTLVANGNNIDCNNADTTPYTLSVDGSGGSFYTSVWYAQNSGAYDGVTWNSHPTGLGFSEAPNLATAITIHSNVYRVDLKEVDLGSATMGGSGFWSSVLYAQTNGSFTAVSWSARSDGNGLDVYPFAGSPIGIRFNCNGFNVTLPNGLNLGGAKLTNPGSGGFSVEGYATVELMPDLTGYYTDPGTAKVKDGESYQFAGDTKTGTYDPITGNFTDPTEAKVLKGTSYVFNGVTKNGTAPRQILGVKAK